MKYTYISTCLRFIVFSLLLRVFKIRVLRRIFGPKRDEVTGVEKTA
jgi:hypothetical protein